MSHIQDSVLKKTTSQLKKQSSRSKTFTET